MRGPSGEEAVVSLGLQQGGSRATAWRQELDRARSDPAPRKWGGRSSQSALQKPHA